MKEPPQVDNSLWNMVLSYSLAGSSKNNDLEYGGCVSTYLSQKRKKKKSKEKDLINNGFLWVTLLYLPSLQERKRPWDIVNPKN